MSLARLYHLRKNPFAVVPSRTNPFWADREKFKSELEKAIKFTLLGSQSQIIACIYGDWGSGKTHAMIYFSSDRILQDIAKEIGTSQDRPPLSIPIIFPLKDVFKSIYLDVIYRNVIPKLGIVLDHVYKQTAPLESEGNVERKFLDMGLNEDLAKVLSQFSNRNKSMLVGRYLSTNASRTDLDKLGVAKGIETNGEMLSTFADLLRLFTNTISSRIFIWIDDCERLDEVPGREMYEFHHFLRDILDLVPEKLTLIINFTQLPGLEVPERMTLLGPAVQDRIAKVIRVLPFNQKDYLKYVEELLENSRIKTKGRVLPKYFPYSEKCLNNIFEMIEKSTSNIQPRTVNRVLSSLLEQGIHEGVSLIDENFLERIKDEVKMAIRS